MKNALMKNQNDSVFAPWGITGLQREVDNLFDDFLRPFNSNKAPASLSYDVIERDDKYLIQMDLPGIKKEDLSIEFRDNQLSITGKRQEERREENTKYHYIGRTWGEFQRTFSLPAGVNGTKIEADYKDGVLTLSLPKAEEAKAQKITIK